MSPEQIRELDENWSPAYAMKLAMDNMEYFKEHYEQNIKSMSIRQEEMAKANKIVEKQVSGIETDLKIQGLKIDQILELSRDNKSEIKEQKDKLDLIDKENSNNTVKITLYSAFGGAIMVFLSKYLK